MTTVTEDDFRERLASCFGQGFEDVAIKRFDTDIREEIRLESATLSPDMCATATCTMQVEAEHCNFFDTLHGGCIALLVDTVTSCMLGCLSGPGFWEDSMSGVSRTMNIRYLRPCAVGKTIRIVTTLVHPGKRSALLRVEVLDDQGRLCAIGEHEKANTIKSSM
ncbi:hypothetical protein KEM52_003247 [Ascosphaera acerosa]|nr:hypothetical protein KEM52_003247 [Ascosphaera acerosa]